jgi:plastocyanin
MRISRSSRVVALTLLLGLVAAACGGDGNDAASPDQNAAGATATGASGSTGDDAGRYGGMGEDETGATGDSGDDAAASGAPVVQANNFSFDPSELEVASGSTITLKNGNANTPHTFTVEDTDIDVELAPLGTDEVKVTVDPGTYDFVCRFHGDMTGTLTVT